MTVDTNPSSKESSERQSPWKAEVFYHDPTDPATTEATIDTMMEIEKSRFPDDPDGEFDRSEFERAAYNTIPTDENGGKVTIVTLVRDKKDNSIFGFTYADAADVAYELPSEDDESNNGFHPERLANPHLSETAYIEDTVFRQSGSGAIVDLMPVFEQELAKNGYKYIERDSAMDHNYGPNILKNNTARSILSYDHKSKWGHQMFICMSIKPLPLAEREALKQGLLESGYASEEEGFTINGPGEVYAPPAATNQS